jgi:two-component system KDP operon response regulator KdpE
MGDDGMVAAQEAGGSRSPADDSRDGRVALVVDDMPEVRKLTCEILGDNGFHCIEANDAEEALQKLFGQRLDIAVLDIGLPGKSGAELAWRMREKGYGIPIVAISGQLHLWDRDDLADLGFDGVFAKPFEEDEFVACIRDLLRRRDDSPRDVPEH